MSSYAGLTDGFEGGAVGAAVSNTNTVFSTTTGAGTAVFTDVNPFAGGRAIQVDVAAANKSLERTLSDVPTKMWHGWAMKVTTAPGAVASIHQYLTGASVISSLRLNTNRTLNFRDGSLNRWTSTTALALEGWYEVRVLGDIVADTARVVLYDDAGTELERSPALTLNSVAASQIDSVHMGILSGATTCGITYDQMVADTVDEPPATANGTPGWLWYDDGSSWRDVSGSLWYDNGSAWVPA